VFPQQQAQLQHALRTEAVDPQEAAGGSGGCTRRHQSDQLGPPDRDTARSRLLLDARQDVVQRGRLIVLDVHAHLCVPGTWQGQPERTHARKTPALLPHDGGDLACQVRVGRVEVDVEGDQRPPRADDHATRARIQPSGSEVRGELAFVQTALKTFRAAPPEERGPTACPRLAVEEDRELQLGADPARDDERALACAIAVGGIDRDDRHDVGSADARMGALVRIQVDALACAGDAGEQRGDQRILVAHEGEHGAVVIRIRVDVEHLRRPGERARERVDGVAVSPLGEVRDRFEREHPSTLGTVKTYYDRRAFEYDDWWRGEGLYAERERPGWEQELDLLAEVIAALPPVRTLDVACGTGFLTRHLRGDVVGLDQSERMLAVAREQAPGVRFVRGDALALPFDQGAFERVFTSYFYCHLEQPERERFLAEARRIARELVIVASVPGAGDPLERREERVLRDGSRWTVYKRVFTGEQLAGELGGGEVLHEGRWFVVVRA
jgi:SAM-dependent methyltransferase